VDRCDVERRRDVSFRGAPFPEVGDGDPLRLHELHRVGGAVGGGHLMGEEAARRVNPSFVPLSLGSLKVLCVPK